MLWAHLLAYVTGTINQKLLLRNEYLTAENRILRGQIKGTSQDRAGNRTLGRADGEGKSQQYRRGSGSQSAHIKDVGIYHRQRPPGLIYHQRAQGNEFLLRAATRMSFLAIACCRKHTDKEFIRS
jgi:hypothetical protein